jgi:hypothetical protein
MKVQVIGLFSSGTNVVVNILEKINGCELKIHGHTHFWKHSIVPTDCVPVLPNTLPCLGSKIDKNSVDNLLSQPDTVFYVIVRCPYLWTKSIHSKDLVKNKVYEIYVGPDGTYRRPDDLYEFITEPASYLGNQYDNIVDLWNKYYMSNITSIPSEKLRIVHYDRMLYDPEYLHNIIKQDAEISYEDFLKIYHSELGHSSVYWNNPVNNSDEAKAKRERQLQNRNMEAYHHVQETIDDSLLEYLSP